MSNGKEKIFSWSNGVQSGAVTPIKAVRASGKGKVVNSECEKCGVKYYSATGSSTCCMTCRWLETEGGNGVDVKKVTPNKVCEACNIGYFSATGKSTLCPNCRTQDQHKVDAICCVCNKTFKLEKHKLKQTANTCDACFKGKKQQRSSLDCDTSGKPRKSVSADANVTALPPVAKPFTVDGVEWHEIADPKNGVYFYNAQTGASVWERPRSKKQEPPIQKTFTCKDGKTWQEVSDPQVGVYYFNPETEESVWEKPEERFVFDDASASAPVPASSGSAAPESSTNTATAGKEAGQALQPIFL